MSILGDARNVLGTIKSIKGQIGGEKDRPSTQTPQDADHTVQIGVASPLASRLEKAMAANGVATNGDGVINPNEAKPIANAIKQMERDGILLKGGFELKDGKMNFSDPDIQALGIAPPPPPAAAPAPKSKGRH
jgi:hypothetical protein